MNTPVKVLLVEDNRGDAVLIREMLAESDGRKYDLDMIDHLEAGLTQLQQHEVDVVLLDLSLPDSQGLDTVRRTIEKAPHKPVVVLTGLDDESTGAAAIKEGAQEYLVKNDLTPRALRRAIRYAMERKRIKLEQEQLVTDLEAFAHTVAHDLRRPLQAVLGYSEMLLDDRYDLSADMTRDLHQAIFDNSEIMSDIIDALLLLAVVRGSDVECSPVAMGDVVGAALRRLQEDIEGMGAEVTLPETWPQAVGYASWLEEVWVNYLSNGLKYGGEPPVLELGARVQQDDMICFWIRDQGPGIAPKEQRRLFTPLTRLTSIGEGHGLGLSIARRIIDKLGGDVGVESNLGEGSRFYFTLPAAAKDKKRGDMQELAGDGLKGRKNAA